MAFVAAVLRALRRRGALLVLLLAALAAVHATGAAAQVPVAPSVPELAFQYRPALLFDGGERWRPLDVDLFLAERGNELCLNRRFLPDDCDAFTDPAQLFSDKFDSADAYLSIHKVDGVLQSPLPSCHAGMLLDCDGQGRSVIYWHAVASGDQLYLDFWYFLRNNAYPTDNHQGDWEGLVVHLAHHADGTYGLVDVVFRQHRRAFRYVNLNILTEPGTSHVAAYLGKGTHATYPRPCRAKALGIDCHQEALVSVGPVGLGLPEASFDGEAPWGANDDATCAALTCVRELPSGGWPFWPGRWGKGQPSLEQPPTGPGNRANFSTPWNATDSTRTTFGSSLHAARTADPSSQPTCDGSWMGYGVQATACDPAALAADYGTEAAPTLAMDGAAATSGVAQRLGAPLRAGQEVTVTGTASAQATLRLALVTPTGVTVGTVPALGLGAGGTATVRVLRSSATAARLRVRDGRGRERQVAIRAPRPAAPAVTATRRGGTVTVALVAAPRARVRVQLLGAGGRTLRRRTVPTSATGVARARLPAAGARSVQVMQGAGATATRKRVTIVPAG